MSVPNVAKPTAVDLFSGAGGVSLGLKLAGYRVIGAIEIDPAACKTYQLNHKHTRLWQSDIRRVSGRTLLNGLNLNRGELDLLAACPPCQGFSGIRTKNGRRAISDPRNDLLFEVVRMVDALRPKMVMMENVPALSKDGRFAIFCRRLKTYGYYISWAILDTSDYAVPQRRRRLVVLASSTSTPDFAPKARKKKTVRDCIGRLDEPETSEDPLHNYTSRRSERVARLIRLVPRDGGGRLDLGPQFQLPCHRRTDGFRDVYGRMSWDRPAPTITGGCINPSKGRFLHPTSDRSITLREAALLQTFPASYRFSLEAGKYFVAQMIGNALPPEFIRRHAAAMKAGLVVWEEDSSTKSWLL